jgi:hypothetical protein
VGDRMEVGYICWFAEVDHHQCPWRLLLAEDRIRLPGAELAGRQLRKLRMAFRFAVAEETQSEEEVGAGGALRQDDGCSNSEPVPF